MHCGQIVRVAQCNSMGNLRHLINIIFLAILMIFSLKNGYFEGLKHLYSKIQEIVSDFRGGTVQQDGQFAASNEISYFWQIRFFSTQQFT